MKYRLSGAAGILCAALVLSLSFQSCKEDTIINANLTPAVDNIHTFGIGPEFGNDTMTILTRTVYDDTAVTNGSNFLALGWVNADDYTGNLAGSLFFQVVPPSIHLQLNAVPDSGFIILPYSGFIWGDTTVASSQTYRVYQMQPSDSLSKDSTYYSYTSRKVLPVEIGSGTLSIDASDGHAVDSVSIYGVNRAPHLRIKLNAAFLNQFYQFLSDTSNTGTFSTFVQRFNGFCIVPDTPSAANYRAMPYFQMLAGSDVYTKANMILYKHAAADTGIYSFPYNGGYAGFFNRVTRSYKPSSEASKIFQAVPPSDLLMVQNQPGATIDIRIPYIKNLPQNAIINKAQIVLTKISVGNDSQYSQPARIYPTGINDFGSRYSIADRYPLNSNEGLDFIDGRPRVLTIGAVTITQYVVNVPREVQQAVALQKRELHLRINGTQTFPGAYRVVTGNRNHSSATYKFALNIVYSKLQ